VGLCAVEPCAVEPYAVILIVAGVSGSGKSTVGALLAGRLGWPFTDGDLLHPDANIAKMARGEPLTDEDRMPWLWAVGASMDQRITAGQSAILACSALKRRYRDLLLADRPTARIAFLQIDRDVAATRLARRHGHFFDPDLLDSQFADLEPPASDEKAVLVVPVQDQPQVIADEIARRLDLDGAAARGPGSGGAGSAGSGSRGAGPGGAGPGGAGPGGAGPGGAGPGGAAPGGPGDV
jgi:gluconokinase